MQNLLAPITLAAHPTTLDTLRRLPAQTWMNLVILIVSVYVVIRVWRTLRSLNEYAPYLAVVVAASAVFFYWVYSRTEPAFLTPIVERVAPFFPTRTSQQEAIEKARKQRE